MRQVAGDDLIYRTIDAAIQCGYRLIGELKTVRKLGWDI